MLHGTLPCTAQNIEDLEKSYALMSCYTIIYSVAAEIHCIFHRWIAEPLRMRPLTSTTRTLTG